MPDICVSSHHGSINELLSDHEFRSLTRRDGFLIELRLDRYSDLSPSSLHAALGVFDRVVATYRHPLEGGGKADVCDEERLGYLSRAADAGARYIDIEMRTPRGTFSKRNSRLILSHHDFEKVPSPEELECLWQRMAADSDADVIKIACKPDDILDSAPLLTLLKAKSAHKPLVALAMGEAGFWTRVAGALFNSPLSYARGERASGTAPGQPSWVELEQVYRFREIQPGWPVYGVMGNPIAHSLSPLMHNLALREMNLEGVYLPFRVEGDPAEFVQAFEPLGIKALSVTIPHKEAAMDICREVHELARSIGAVNTLLKRPDDNWWGTNTDAFAAADALEEMVGSLYGKNVLILGAGGAAKAVAFGVKMRGAHVFIANRTIEHAVSLASAVDGAVIKYEELDGRPNFAAVVNTTPVGMYPDVHRSPLDKGQIPEGSIVFDTVYNPLRTKLLDLAREKGCQTLEGVAMFIRQGVWQFELYTNVKAPRQSMEKAVLSALENLKPARADMASGMFRNVPRPDDAPR